MKKGKKIASAILIVSAIIAAATAAYIQDYYHSEAEALQYMQGTESVQVVEITDGLWIDGAGSGDALIFYPGAKVEYSAYLPLLVELAEQGVDSFLVHMPANFAFLGMNKADDIMQQYDYEHWYIGGHSLGGAMAAAYGAEHLDSLQGVVLLAAYPTKSLQGEDFSVVSIYGSEDGVLQMDKVEAGRQYMPQRYLEVCIQGGNHAQFGAYGAQKGDGKAQLTSQEQRQQTIEAILQIME